MHHFYDVRRRAYVHAEIHKKDERFQVSYLTFSRHGVKLSVVLTPLPSESRFHALYHRLFQQKCICKPTGFFVFCCQVRNVCKRPLCLALFYRLDSGVQVGPADVCQGASIRPFLVWMLSQSRKVILFEVAMLAFDGRYSQKVFSAGNPLIRHSSSHPHDNDDSPFQTGSIPACGIPFAYSNSGCSSMQFELRVLNPDLAVFCLRRRPFLNSIPNKQII